MDLSKSDTEDGTESDEEVPVAVTSDSDDKQEPIKTAMGKNDTVLRKGIYMGEKTSYVVKIDMKKYLKKMLKFSCTDKETKESIKQFLKSNDLVLSKVPFCCLVYECWLRIELTKIKMSSVMPFSFNGVKLYVMTINENHGYVLKRSAEHLNIKRPPRPPMS